MKLRAGPLLSLVWGDQSLRRGAIICVALALFASAAEIAVALSMVPVLASLGVDAGDELGGILSNVPAWQWLALFALTAALRSILNWRSSIQEERSTYELVASLQSRLYRALSGAHWDAVRHISPPKITNALQTQTYEAGFGFSSMVNVATAALLVLGYLVSTAMVFPIALPALLLTLAFMWWLNAGHTDRVQSHSEDMVGAQEELHQRYEDWVAISRISSLGADARSLTDRFESNAREVASHAVRYGRTTASTRISYDMALVAGILVGVPVAWWLETPPALLVFGLLAFMRVLPRSSNIQASYQRVVNAVAPLQSVESLTNRLEADSVAAPSSAAPLNWQKLELSNIGVQDTAREDGRRWLLSDVNLTVEHGEWLGITGPTGAGKSTLSEVLLMLIRSDAGEITIDDRIVADDLANDWRNQAAYVPQDVVLFDASIRDNLRLYVPDATDAELSVALAKSAGDFVISRLPEGLDTRAGPGGRWLSGGERQRIGIARALLRNPGFLVLDEPTAALDNDTQGKLMEALASLDHKMSVVLITHRPELLKLVDRIIEINNGRITHQGDASPGNGVAPRHQ